MLDIDTINTLAKPSINDDLKEYYYFRKILHDIYDHDILYGDLVGEILACRDKNRHIESVSIDLKNYKIYMDLNGNPEEQSKIIFNVINNIDTILRSFISNASDQVCSRGEKMIVDKFLNSKWYICDSYVMFPTVELNL